MSTDQLLLILILLLSVVILVFVLVNQLRTGRSMGALQVYAEDIRKSHLSLEQMLRIPKERASFGETSLEIILADQLPQDMYSIRKKCLDGKIPDAHIKSPDGIICIDSKFPLDNYIKMLNEEDPRQQENFRKYFLNDIRNHIEKIAQDYVCPHKGSAQFAVAYIPSEGVYYFLITEAGEILREYIKRGVQVASPLTLSNNLEYIKSGIRVMKLNENAQQVMDRLHNLSEQFQKLDEGWRVYCGHFRNIANNEARVDEAYDRLREEFNRISQDYLLFKA